MGCSSAFLPEYLCLLLPNLLFLSLLSFSSLVSPENLCFSLLFLPLIILFSPLFFGMIFPSSSPSTFIHTLLLSLGSLAQGVHQQSRQTRFRCVGRRARQRHILVRNRDNSGGCTPPQGSCQIPPPTDPPTSLFTLKSRTLSQRTSPPTRLMQLIKPLRGIPPQSSSQMFLA